jgi:hypothetical protein
MASEKPVPKADVTRRHWSVPHVAGVALAIAAYFGIYSVTGDSDLFLALATGAAGGALTWLAWKLNTGSAGVSRLEPGCRGRSVASRSVSGLPGVFPTLC